METLLANLDLAQYGAAALPLGLVLYLWHSERQDRRAADQRVIETLQETNSQLVETFRMVDKAVDFIKAR